MSACSAEDSGSDDTENAAEAGDEAPAEEEAVETCEVAPAVEGGGTDFAAPLELCQAASIEGWDIAVTAVELDATATVMDANTFNEEPADGSQYLMFTLTGTNTGTEAVDPFIGLNTAVDIADYRYEDTCGVLPNDLVDVGEVAPGESFTANDCVFVDSDRSRSRCSPSPTSCRWKRPRSISNSASRRTDRRTREADFGRTRGPPLSTTNTFRSNAEDCFRLDRIATIESSSSCAPVHGFPDNAKYQVGSVATGRVTTPDASVVETPP